MGDSTDEEENDIQIQNSVEDVLFLEQNYEKFKEQNISKPILSKYEKTKILSERTQQLSNGSVSFLQNPESYASIYEIALEELKQKKLPFIIKRPVSNRFEYWKLSDLSIL